MPQTATLPASPALLPAEIVGLSFQNAGAGTLAAGVATFGQAFVRGDVPAGAGHLTARLGTGEVVPVQMDVKTRYEDGSVKFAVLSVERPEMAAGATLELALSAAGGGPAPAAAPVDMAAALAARSFAVDITTAAGATTTVDVFARLQQALADGTAQVWQSGPLAAQARVEVDMPGSQRLLFDVTVFQDGEFKVNALFNNDEAMGPTGGRVDFEAVVRMDGAEVFRKTVSQGQYQNWRETFSSDEANGGQLTGDPSGGWLNIRHDLPYLSESGAVARYDTKVGIDEGLIQSWEQDMAAPGWGEALAANGIRQTMGDPGGREDLGITTAGNTAWLMSGDARAAKYALDQAETSGAIPWNTWDVGNKTWLNTDDYPRLWTSGRGGTGTPGDRNAGGLAQQIPTDTGWSLDRSHQPDLSFVPYLLTGERMHLDAVQAQASFSIMNLWAFPRQKDADLLTGNGDQIRGSAWSMRQVEHAAWSSPDGSREKAYFQQVASDNWAYLVSRIPEWTAAQGEAYGWVPGQNSSAGIITQFGQDYFATTSIMAATRGNADALTFLNWQSNFLIGRFLNADKGFNPRDGVAYSVAAGPEGVFSLSFGTLQNAYQTWAEMGAATVARGMSNGETGWAASNGEYGRLAMASLAGIYHLTGNADALRAYQLIAAESPPWTREQFWALRPNYAVTIEGVYGGTIVGTAGDDFWAPKSGAPGLRADLGEGFDRLDLGANGNTGWARNVEVLNGSAGADTIEVASPLGGTTVDLRGGFDTLTLADGGQLVFVRNVEALVGGAGNDTVVFGAQVAPGMLIDMAGGAGDRVVLATGTNAVTVANAETIVGGAGNDTVTLATEAAVGATVDLGAGLDRLILARSNNTISVANTETIQGESGQDEVTFTTAAAPGAFVDLGGGKDTLTLANGANTVRVANTETVRGGSGADNITLATATNGAVVDLAGGTDRLTLANGSNLLTVSNVETVVGGTGNDNVRLGAPVSAATVVDLGGGGDRLTLADGTNALTVRNTEAVLGGAGDDSVTFGTAVAASTLIDLGAGADRVTLGNFANTARLVGVETVIGGALADSVTLVTPSSAELVDLGAGTDRLTLAGTGDYRVTVRNVEAIVANGGNDEVTLGTVAANVSVNLGTGADRLRLADGANAVTVSNTEEILGGAGADAVTLATGAANALVSLGAGADRLTLGNFTNTVTVRDVEAVRGGTGADSVTFATAALAGMTVDLGAGADRLTLGDFANTISVSGAEFVQGGALDDAVTLGAGATGTVTVDLGAGADSLALAASGGTYILRNVERATGGAGADTVTLQTASVGGRFDLGGGVDRLVLAAGGNDVTVLNAESLQGGGGDDVVTLGNAVNGLVVDLSAGNDRLVLAAGTNALTVAGVETVQGGSGNDTVTVSVSFTNGVVDLGGGVDRLVLANAANSVRVSNVETVVGGSSVDRITATGTAAARLEGGAGSDTLVGGDGGDVLHGGAGADWLTGGAGNDRFLYRATAEGGDTITDFNGNGDLLVFQGMLRGTFDFRGAGAFLTDGQSQARYVEGSRQLQVDVNGDANADITITLQGVSLSQLSAADFMWM